MREPSAVSPPSPMRLESEKTRSQTFRDDVWSGGRFFDVALLTAIYSVVVWFGQRRDLWYDELFTWHLARLPRVLDVWDALRDGVDLNPPLSYVLVRASQSVFGDGGLGTRLPFMIALCAASWCLYAFLSRRTSRVVAFATALLPLASKVFLYGFEARPYALLLLCSAASMLFWQRAIDTTSSTQCRKTALCGLTLSLAIAVSSHYFGVFLLWPLFVGEMARWHRNRRFDRAVLIALFAGAAPLLAFLPLLRDARQYAKGFWAQPEIVADTLRFYEQFAEVLWVIALVLGATWIVVWRMRREKIVSSANAFLFAEWATVAALATLPVVCVAAAWLAGSGYVFRYAVAGVIGVILLLGMAAGATEKRWAWAKWLYAAMCIGGVLVNQSAMPVWRTDNRVLEVNKLLSKAMPMLPRDAPVVISEPQLFLQLFHHAPPSLRKRLVYLSDFSLSLHYLKNDTGDRALSKMSRWTRVPVRDYRGFVGKNRRFVLLENENSWTTAHLRASRARLQLVGQHGSERLFLVEIEP